MPAKHHQETQSAANQAKRILCLSADGPELFRAGEDIRAIVIQTVGAHARPQMTVLHRTPANLESSTRKLGVLSRRWRPSSRTAGPNRDPSPILDASWLRSVSCDRARSHWATKRLSASARLAMRRQRQRVLSLPPKPLDPRFPSYAFL